MCYKYLTLVISEGMATVAINRTEKRNAICREMLAEIVDVFQQIDMDGQVGVVVLTGEGKTFIAGADIEEMSAMAPLDYLEYGTLFMKAAKAIRENSKPVIGAINGVAFGGGNALALACDIIVASEKAKFGQQEINLGIFGGAYLLPKLVGRCRAAEIVMLGDAFSAQDALAMGLVNRVVAPEELSKTVDEIVRKLLSKSPLALRLAKESIRVGFTYDIDLAASYQTGLMSIMYSSHDQKEGMSAFLAKREAIFTGK